MPLVLYEDKPENFWPLTLTRATFELRYGALSPLERALRKSPHVVLRCRPELAPYVRARTGLPVNDDITPQDLVDAEPFPGLPGDAPWDVLTQSAKLITDDFCDWSRDHENHRDAALMPGAHIVGKREDVHIGEGSVVQPGCVLDATGGPIILAAGVQVKWTNIKGRFCGARLHSRRRRVRPGTSLGHTAKIGGEIAATIFSEPCQQKRTMASSATPGAGRWVNFGAGATTSNHENTYGTIRYQRDSRITVETGKPVLRLDHR
jgi:hypothetical protein